MAADRFPPVGSCDCHLHVVGPKAVYPLAARRAFTPKDATLAQLNAMHARLGIDRLVLIQTSVFGHDNRCMLDGLSRLGARARGIAVVADDTPGHELDRMHRLGVRGLRVNIATYGTRSPEEVARRLKAAARLCGRNGWHVQLFVGADALAALMPVIEALPVDCVIDHFGLLHPGLPGHPARPVLRALLEAGRTWVKISGAYRLGKGTGNDVQDPAIGELARPSVPGQPRAHCLGHRLAAYARARRGRRRRPGTALPGYRSRRSAGPAACLVRRRYAGAGAHLVRNPSALYFSDTPQ